jgi:hypothetical protein
VLRPAVATLVHAMPMRLRKFIGTVALFALVIIWALLAMAVAQFPAIRDHMLLSIAYYVIAGLGWIVPAMPLVSWMSTPRPGDKSRGPRSNI